MYLYILIVSIVLYTILHYLDDKRNISLHKPPSSTSSKVALMFFSFIITTVCFYLFWDSTISEVIDSQIDSQIDGGGLIEEAINHLDYIDQDIHTGFPDF